MVRGFGWLLLALFRWFQSSWAALGCCYERLGAVLVLSGFFSVDPACFLLFSCFLRSYFCCGVPSCSWVWGCCLAAVPKVPAVFLALISQRGFLVPLVAVTCLLNPICCCYGMLAALRFSFAGWWCFATFAGVEIRS
ncbi:hypothetical protein U1Q18_032950 [Sarracenia purpurea var. burkii]